jgi:site-specific DNA recombinase
MKQLFAYIRVSDPKQKTGVSLIEQRAIIERYAERIGALIVVWFEETRTAAKAGRPIFTKMLGLLRAGKAEGVIIHKLDRGTRNYRDWAAIDELLDAGVGIYVANENLDLRSRGGRLAADVQVAVAVDYIRNLREEALKGIHGRLKQGILPNAAAVGYLDRGKGNPKEIDPKKGPLVRRLFELYATGGYTLRELTAEAKVIGLRNRSRHAYCLQQIDDVLKNPFYMGIIRSRRYGLFPGKHQPLVSAKLFERVQTVLSGRYVRRTKRCSFLFRRFIRCQTCGRSLSGSERKGRVYYRCPTIACPTTSLREDAIEAAVRAQLRKITFGVEHAALLERELSARLADETSLRAAKRAALQETLAAVNARLARLTDLLLDGKIDSGAHDEKRAALIMEREGLLQEIAAVETGSVDFRATIAKMFELLASAETLYESVGPEKKRELLEMVTSNCTAHGKSLSFSIREPFATLAQRDLVQSGGQFYDTVRTFGVETLISWAKNCSSAEGDALQSISQGEDVKIPPLAA